MSSELIASLSTSLRLWFIAGFPPNAAAADQSASKPRLGRREILSTTAFRLAATVRSVSAKCAMFYLRAGRLPNINLLTLQTDI